MVSLDTAATGKLLKPPLRHQSPGQHHPSLGGSRLAWSRSAATGSASARDAWWEPRALALWAVVSIWGGSMGGIFTVGITLLGQRFRDIELVSANAVFSVLFGIGGLLGPFLAGTAMSAIGPAGFPLSLLAAVGIYALFALYRQFSRA